MTIATARNYWEHMVNPDYEEFTANSLSLRKAMHLASSLYHLHEWVFNDYHMNNQKIFGCTSAGQIVGHLIANECQDFALIQDLANAQKHFKLTRGNPQLTQADQVDVRETGWDELPWDDGEWDGPPAVIVELDDQSLRAFTAIAKNVFEMWERLFQQQNW